MSTPSLDGYYRDVVLPCKGFNLAYHMMDQSPMHWDFDKVERELAEIKAQVQSIKQGQAA